MSEKTVEGINRVLDTIRRVMDEQSSTPDLVWLGSNLASAVNRLLPDLSYRRIWSAISTLTSLGVLSSVDVPPARFNTYTMTSTGVLRVKWTLLLLSARVVEEGGYLQLAEE